MPRRLPSPLLALALAAGSPAWAQNSASPMLDPVVVTAQRDRDLPAASTLAGRDSRKAATADTAALLNDLPGVSTAGAGGVSSLPVIHGMADDRLRINIDGMDLVSACANHMNPPLSYIDPSAVDSVQVFAGITPVSVGGDSIGGSIVVKSAPPVFAEPGRGLLTRGQVGGFYRSNGDAWGANLAASAASDTISVAYTGSTVEAGNYRAAKRFKNGAISTGTLKNVWVAGDEVASSQYQSQNHSLGLAARHDNHLLELKLGVQSIPYQGFPNQRMDMTDNSSQQINLRYAGHYDWGTLEARAYEENTRHAMNFLAAKRTTAGGMPMDTRGKTSGAQLKADLSLSERDTLRVGTEYRRYRLDDWWDPVAASGMMGGSAFWNIKHGQRDNVDVFGEWEARWSTPWLSQLGLRRSTLRMNTGTVQGYNSTSYGDPTLASSIPGAFNAQNRRKTDDNLDLTALARYTASQAADYEFGYARKTRSPNLYERFAWASNNSMVMNMVNWTGEANGYVGNLDLKPEIAHTVSATADWHAAGRDAWGLKATPYYTYIEDYIDARRCAGGTGSSPCTAANLTRSSGFVYLQFVNQSAELYGADLSGHYRLGRTAGYGSFTLNGLVNYTRGRNKTTDDNLYNIMPLNAKLSLVQKTGSWTNTVETQLVGAKDEVSQVRNELKTSGYGLLNLRSSKEWQDVRVDFGIENALNKFYYLPQGGAYVGQRTMTYGTAVPGIGRSAYLGVTLKF